MRRAMERLLAGVDGAMARGAIAFMSLWSRLERGYRRPASRMALRLRFAFYPLLALLALGWLAMDWRGERSLDAAENAVFDRILRWRPLEPAPSGRVAIVEIDDCSIEHFIRKGEGGWPWSRQRHADLLDALDRAGVRAVAYDVVFADRSPADPDGDAALEAMAAGGDGRFLFASSRLHRDFDAGQALRASLVPNSFPLVARPQSPGPPIALIPPYGAQMTRHSAITNITRDDDGVLRDFPLYERAGDWALPSLPLQLARAAGWTQRSPRGVRINWRRELPLQMISAANLIEGSDVCAGGARTAVVRGAAVVVGYTAAGIADAKPTPLEPRMAGAEVLAEATESLLAGSAIWMPPVWAKYWLAALLVAFTTFAFWRGEPHEDVDSVFVAVNLTLLVIAFAGMTLFGAFIDIFASIGFVSLCFGACRMYAAVQRGRAVGNNDYLPEYDPARQPWMAMARLRYTVPPGANDALAARRRREYRRRLRRHLYGGTEAVMIEGVVERKSWLHEILDDLMLLVWTGEDRAQVLERARVGLDRLFADLNANGALLDGNDAVMVALVSAQIDDHAEAGTGGERMRLRELLSRDLEHHQEWPLSARNAFSDAAPSPAPGTEPHR